MQPEDAEKIELAKSRSNPDEFKQEADAGMSVDDESFKHKLLGTVFENKYRIVSVLGEGGMSIVYLCIHEALDRPYAIKVLQTHLASKTTSLLRFKQEAQSVSTLTHPNIVGMHDYGVTADGTPYLVMDFIDGKSLSDVLEQEKKISPEEAANIFIQCASAFAHAHKRGIIHRDIKPSNIMLYKDSERDERRPKIVDFGVAKVTQADQSAKLTQTGESVGSPLYMSPEQCLGQQLDVRSDIYSFGCVMYEALTGTTPFAADSIFGTMVKQMHEIAPSFNSQNIKEAAPLERIVFKCLAKEPARRYQNMDVLRIDLQSIRKKKGVIRTLTQNIELQGMRLSSSKAKRLTVVSIVLASGIFAVLVTVYHTVQSIRATPNYYAEAPLWTTFSEPENPRTRTGDAERDELLDLTQEMLMQTDSTKHSAMAQLSRALALRKKREYDSAALNFREAVLGFTHQLKQIPESDIAHFEKETQLFKAYSGKADCEYFSVTPQFSHACEDYKNAFTVLRSMRGRKFANVRTEESRALARYADCFYQKHDLAGAKERFKRAFDPAYADCLLPSRDPTYFDLALAKYAECQFLTAQEHSVSEGDQKESLLDAEAKYLLAVGTDKTGQVINVFGWNSLGGQQANIAKASGRLVEIEVLLGRDPSDYLHAFEQTQTSLQVTNDEAVKEFVANVKRSYVSYLWRQGRYSAALQKYWSIN